jgi:hypothetical protein
VRAAPPHLPADPDTDTPALAAPTGDSPAPGVIKTDPRKAISFNCGVENCGVRQTHEFAKKSYEKGIVIVQCPGCKSRCVLSSFWYERERADEAAATSSRTTSAGSRRSRPRALSAPSRTLQRPRASPSSEGTSTRTAR